MNREQQTEKAAEALASAGGQLQDSAYWLPEARAVLDAILPQVTTVAELEALPARSLLKGANDGDVWQCSGYRQRIGHSPWDCLSEDGTAGGYTAETVIDRSAPLTVVWQP